MPNVHRHLPAFPSHRDRGAPTRNRSRRGRRDRRVAHGRWVGASRRSLPRLPGPRSARGGRPDPDGRPPHPARHGGHRGNVPQRGARVSPGNRDPGRCVAPGARRAPSSERPFSRTD